MKGLTKIANSFVAGPLRRGHPNIYRGIRLPYRFPRVSDFINFPKSSII